MIAMMTKMLGLLVEIWVTLAVCWWEKEMFKNTEILRSNCFCEQMGIGKLD